MVIDVKPATTLKEASDQMEEAMGMCADHYIRVCDTVLYNWSMICKSVDVDALLALADEMNEVAQRRRSMGYEGFAIGDEDRASRIREALGVDDG